MASKGEARDVIQFARVNQLQVPFFKCQDAIFIRDEQYGNYRHYYVSKFRIQYPLLRQLLGWSSPSLGIAKCDPRRVRIPPQTPP